MYFSAFYWIGPLADLVYKLQCPCVCRLSVPSVSYLNQKNWRFQVKKPNAKIAKLRTLFSKSFDGLWLFLGVLSWKTSCLLEDNSEWWFQKRNITDPHGSLGGKYKPFGKHKLASYLEKTTQNPSVQDLKIKRNIHFLVLFF